MIEDSYISLHLDLLAFINEYLIAYARKLLKLFVNNLKRVKSTGARQKSIEIKLNLVGVLVNLCINSTGWSVASNNRKRYMKCESVVWVCYNDSVHPHDVIIAEICHFSENIVRVKKVKCFVNLRNCVPLTLSSVVFCIEKSRCGHADFSIRRASPAIDAANNPIFN